MKLPKSIIKKHGITKKAWAIFRRKRKGGGKKKRTRARVTPKRRKRRKSKALTAGRQPGTTGGKTMARRRKRRSVKHSIRRARRHASVMAGSTTGKVLVGAAEVAAGAAASAIIVNKGPMIKDASPTVKSGVQIVLGILAIRFFRNPHLKTVGAGAVVSAVMGIAKNVLKVEPLAGPGGGTLSPADLRALSQGLGIPIESMGIPLQPMNGSVAMSAPTGFTGGFNRR